MHYGSSKRSVFFKVKRGDQLLIFRFGTLRGEVICTSLQQHINHAFMRRFKVGFPPLAACTFLFCSQQLYTDPKP